MLESASDQNYFELIPRALSLLIQVSVRIFNAFVRGAGGQILYYRLAHIKGLSRIR